jgi:hypothetical protein
VDWGNSTLYKNEILYQNDLERFLDDRNSEEIKAAAKRRMESLFPDRFAKSSFDPIVVTGGKEPANNYNKVYVLAAVAGVAYLMYKHERKRKRGR